MSTWKAVERGIARLIGGERVPVTGRQRGSAPDIACESDFLSVEVKHRASLPSWLLDALRQAECSKRGTQLPVAILHQKNMQYQDSLMVIRLADFVEWFGKTGKTG